MVWVGDERFETQHRLYVPFRLSHPRPAKGKSSWRRGRRAWPTSFSILQSGTILMYFFCTGLELALSCTFYTLENRRCNVSVLCGRSLWSTLFWLESIHDCSVQRAFKWKQSSEFWEIKTKTLKLRTIWYFCWFVFIFKICRPRKKRGIPKVEFKWKWFKNIIKRYFWLLVFVCRKFNSQTPFHLFQVLLYINC